MRRAFTPLLLAGLTTLGATAAQAALPETATLYKNPECRCCDGYARHLEEQGVDVTAVSSSKCNAIEGCSGQQSIS